MKNRKLILEFKDWTDAPFTETDIYNIKIAFEEILTSDYEVDVIELRVEDVDETNRS